MTTEAILLDGVVACSRCRKDLVPIQETRRKPRRGRAMTELVGYQCPKCGAGFNVSLAPDHRNSR